MLKEESPLEASRSVSCCLPHHPVDDKQRKDGRNVEGTILTSFYINYDAALKLMIEYPQKCDHLWKFHISARPSIVCQWLSRSLLKCWTKGCYIWYTVQCCSLEKRSDQCIAFLGNYCHTCRHSNSSLLFCHEFLWWENVYIPLWTINMFWLRQFGTAMKAFALKCGWKRFWNFLLCFQASPMVIVKAVNGHAASSTLMLETGASHCTRLLFYYYYFIIICYSNFVTVTSP